MEACVGRVARDGLSDHDELEGQAPTSTFPNVFFQNILVLEVTFCCL